MREIIYHGSEFEIPRPVYRGGKPYNDYGHGFYCTRDMALAKEWAVTPEHDGFVNKYEIDCSGLRILCLNDYSILHWLSVLLMHRTFNIVSALASDAKDYLTDNFRVDMRQVDIVTGYRADDSYFSFAQDFLNGAISYRQLAEAMRLGKLGEQFVIRSKRAYDAILFLEATPVPRTQWLARRERREQEARRTYFSYTRANRRKGDLYITQILDEEIREGDERLQSI